MIPWVLIVSCLMRVACSMFMKVSTPMPTENSMINSNPVRMVRITLDVPGINLSINISSLFMLLGAIDYHK
jgi:hypothetical protein